MGKFITLNLECINSVKNYLIRNILYGNDCMHNTVKMRLISLLICHIQYYLFVFPNENTFGYLYNLVRYESNQDIIKYPQLLTHIHRKNDSGRTNQTIIASHQRWPKIFPLLVIRTRNILLPQLQSLWEKKCPLGTYHSHIRMIPGRSTFLYDKN